MNNTLKKEFNNFAVFLVLIVLAGNIFSPFYNDIKTGIGPKSPQHFSVGVIGKFPRKRTLNGSKKYQYVEFAHKG
jgi:hypothetical protein